MPKKKTLSKYGKPVGRPPLSDEERERRAKLKEEKKKELDGVELIPQPHGGALRRGNPGNKGRPSASPADLRAAMRGSLRDRLYILNEIADDTRQPAETRMKALDLMFKFGLGKRDEVANTHENAPVVIRQIDKVEINIQRERVETALLDGDDEAAAFASARINELRLGPGANEGNNEENGEEGGVEFVDYEIEGEVEGEIQEEADEREGEQETE